MLGLVLLAHRRPHVGVDGVGARAPRRTGSATSSIAAAEVAGPVDDVVVELVARRATRPTSSTPDERGAERERRGDVVAVADVRDAPALEVAEVLAQREEVGERLARVRAVGQQVDDRDVDRPRPCARACAWSNTRAAITAQ